MAKITMVRITEAMYESLIKDNARLETEVQKLLGLLRDAIEDMEDGGIDTTRFEQALEDE